MDSQAWRRVQLDDEGGGGDSTTGTSCRDGTAGFLGASAGGLSEESLSERGRQKQGGREMPLAAKSQTAHPSLAVKLETDAGEGNTDSECGTTSTGDLLRGPPHDSVGVTGKPPPPLRTSPQAASIPPQGPEPGVDEGERSMRVKMEPESSDYEHCWRTHPSRCSPERNLETSPETEREAARFSAGTASETIKHEVDGGCVLRAEVGKARRKRNVLTTTVTQPTAALSCSSEDDLNNADAMQALPVHFEGGTKIQAGKRNIYECGACAVAFVVPAQLNEHMALHGVGDKSYRCGACFKTFNHFSRLMRHVVMHTGEKRYKCDRCGSTFTRLQYLKKHLTGHPDIQLHPCQLCQEVFAVPRDLQRHVHRRHGQERRFRCEVCPSVFSRQSNLNAHLKTHLSQKPYPCDQCPAAFARFSTLQIHKGVHSQERPYRCDQCPSTFTNPSGLRRHLTYHSGEKPYVCELCSCRFRTASHLKSHMRVHSDERPYHCEQCAATFRHPAALKSHMFSHSEAKAFKCEECQAEYWTPSGLKKHRLVHTGEKPYKCQLCPRAYRQSPALKIHMLCHQGRKPCKCPHCPAEFRTASKLKQHTRVHGNDEPHKCEHCSAAFPKAYLVRQHMKKVHRDGLLTACCGDGPEVDAEVGAVQAGALLSGDDRDVSSESEMESESDASFHSQVGGEKPVDRLKESPERDLNTKAGALLFSIHHSSCHTQAVAGKPAPSTKKKS